MQGADSHRGETVQPARIRPARIAGAALLSAAALFAAGFLFGHTSGKSLAECARLGGIAAAEVISHVGARPEQALSKLI